MKFYIARPLDRFGNTLGPRAIISAEETERSIFGTTIKVIGPESVQKRWPSFSTGSASLVEVPAHFGPARKLTFEEHQALWKQYLEEAGPKVAEQEADALKRSTFNY